MAFLKVEKKSWSWHLELSSTSFFFFGNFIIISSLSRFFSKLWPAWKIINFRWSKIGNDKVVRFYRDAWLMSETMYTSLFKDFKWFSCCFAVPAWHSKNYGLIWMSGFYRKKVKHLDPCQNLRYSILLV